MTEFTVSTDKPVVMLTVEEFERMKETIEIFSNPSTVRNIKTGRREFIEGKTVELNKFWREEMDTE